MYAPMKNFVSAAADAAVWRIATPLAFAKKLFATHDSLARVMMAAMGNIRRIIR
jgi:hypothetical protein